MSYNKDDIDFGSPTPKKADVLIRSTQAIALKQEELSEQTKQAISKINEAIELSNKSSKDAAYMLDRCNEMFNKLSEENAALRHELGSIGLGNKSGQDAAYIFDRCNEMFDKLSEENAALKHELLYLAKQSENIYSGLAEQISDIQGGYRSQQQPTTVNVDTGELSDKLTDIYQRLAELSARIDSRQPDRSGDALGDRLGDRLAVLGDRVEAVSSSTAKSFAELSEKLDAVSAGSAKSASPVMSESDAAEILDKLARLAENMRKNESAHSMLADKFEILSMRVEQFGYESAKAQPAYPHSQHAPAYPSPVLAAEIDYDKLAAKVADIMSVREAVSPDYIASKVAEQLVMPETVAAEADAKKIAAEVVSLMGTAPAAEEAPAFNSEEIVDELTKKVSEIVAESKAEPLDEDALIEKLAERLGGIITESKAEPLDEEGLAERLAEKLGSSKEEIVNPVDIDEDSLAEKIAAKIGFAASDELASASVPLDINEDVLAEKIAEKLNVVAENEVVTGGTELDDNALADKIAARLAGIMPQVNTEGLLDQEELADSIALKVGSLRPEDFEILVDDAGCASISKEIAEKLDYRVISSVIADKLREILDINAANAPDYEDMAERISEKITVAGINEDAIADKAAAVLSNYLPELDTEEITDKVTGAVIDVINAMPQHSLDSEAIISEITERLIAKQEENNYDIVIDDDGISRITAIVIDELEKNTDARFDRVEESIKSLTEMLTPDEEEPEEVEEVEEPEIEEVEDEPEVSLSEVVAAEVEKGTAARFDKVDEDIARIYELVSNIVVEEETDETDAVEDEAAEEDGEYTEEVVSEADFDRLSEIVASEIEKGVTSRLDSVDEKLAALTEMLTPEEEEELEEEAEGEEAVGEEGEEAETEELAEEEESEDEIATLTSLVTSRLDSVDEKLAALTEMLTPEEEEEPEEEAEGEEAEETDEVEDVESEELEEEDEEYTKLSEIVAQMETNLSARFDTVEDKISSLTDMLVAEEDEVSDEGESEEVNTEEEYEEEFAEESEDEITKLSSLMTSRFDSMDEKLSALTEMFTAEENVEYAEATEEDYDKLSEIISSEIEKGVSARLDSVEENVRRISAIVGGIAVSGVAADGTKSSVEADIRLLEQFDKVSEDIKRISDFVEGEVPVIANERIDKIAMEVARISQLVEGELSIETNARLDKLHEEIEKLSEKLGESSGSGVDDGRLERVEGGVAEIKDLLAGGVTASAAKEETAVAQTAEAEEEQELITVSDIVKPVSVEEFAEEDEEEDDGDFLLSALDMDKFSDDERMPGELDLDGGVDFENMMKYNRSFIARIIQSDDDVKQYYGSVKQALLSYRKVNSNVAWGNERFNKGRETIARMKIRGKTLVIYLALDPNEYKTSVYHHTDVSDNKSVLGTPMMIKVKSPLGVRKAIRLIDEMLAKRNGEKRDVPERDYAAMYPYETIEELIEDGLVKDVRKK